MGHLLGGLLVALFGGRRVSFASAKESVEDLDYLKGLLVEGKLRTVLDKTFALEDMAAAHAHVDTGQKVGNVVIEVTGSERVSGTPADGG